jgi:hypothetical protein
VPEICDRQTKLERVWRSEDGIRGVSARLKKGDGPLCPPPAITRLPAVHVSGQRSGVHPKTETRKIGTLFIEWHGGVLES